MAEETSTLEIRQLSPGEVPAGATITAAPTEPEEAVSFELIPIPKEVAAPPTIPPPVPVYIEPEPIPAPPKIPPPPKDEVLKEIKTFFGAPEEIGAGEYLGILWALTLKEAEEMAKLKFGGEVDDYIIDIYGRAAKPYFCIKKPKRPIIAPLELAEEIPLTPLEKKEGIKEVECLRCLSKFEIPITAKTWTCPVCGELVTIEKI